MVLGFLAEGMRPVSTAAAFCMGAGACGKKQGALNHQQSIFDEMME